MDYHTGSGAADSSIKTTYLEPADVKSPHRSELGWAAGMEDPKSNRGAGWGGGGAEQDENYLENVRLPLKSVFGTRARCSPVFVCTAETVCWAPGGGIRPPAFAPGGGGRRPPPMGRVLAPPASFFLMFCDDQKPLLLSYHFRHKIYHCSVC